MGNRESNKAGVGWLVGEGWISRQAAYGSRLSVDGRSLSFVCECVVASHVLLDTVETCVGMGSAVPITHCNFVN